MTTATMVEPIIVNSHTILNDSNSSQNSITSIQNSLIESFQQVCSVEQMELCQRLGMLSKSEQQQAYKMAKALIENRQVPVTAEDWNTLTEWVLTLRDRYMMHLESQCIRQISSDQERIKYLDQVQGLSNLLEEYGQAHDDLTDLLQALKKLRNDWKHRKRDVENIILSILSSSLLKNTDFRVVKVSRSNLATLGLGLSSIGKYYIVYEASMTDELKKDVLNNVAKDFGMVFQENAAQNLARMAGSYHRIFHQEDEKVDVIEDIQNLTKQVYINRPNSVMLPYPTSLPTHTLLAEFENDTPGSSTPLHKRESTFLERRKSIIILDNNNDGDEPNGDSTLLFNMAKPVFEPAGWDWPNILKYKRPRSRSGNGSYYWCRQILLTHGEKDLIHDNTGVWSTSISKLSDHFAKIGQDYYSNMLNNARLMHSHRAQMFEFATHSLLKTYRALQLEQGCANLSRTLTFLYRFQQESTRI
ncbi:hypothetical protein BDF21DRAFT_427576 [Thamnidium elegans]|uniref:Uncharacterized protein n=1 Tax=Thamnidium elegans TaxID=101142 RepID=A0A8H7VYP1_9FUNG|nr:hypothetical protein INT48_007160 [Thamnidium elegans]KAI8064997.1 hypothetical protein BDF21DRAFT_427576 [Thamnidium elegans]